MLLIFIVLLHSLFTLLLESINQFFLFSFRLIIAFYWRIKMQVVAHIVKISQKVIRSMVLKLSTLLYLKCCTEELIIWAVVPLPCIIQHQAACPPRNT